MTTGPEGPELGPATEAMPVPVQAVPPAPPQPGEPGWLLGGRYQVIDRIGAGGMAEVFRAHDQLLARDVAVKVFRTHSDPDDVTGGVQRQELELQTLARLSHPNLITLFDGSIGSDGEPAFLVMELINGPSLAAQIAQAPLTEPETREIAIQIAGALAYVHAQHMVHRDIKPANILLGTDGTTGDTAVRARLSDFGIVRLLGSEHLTSADFMVGTASYLAPEQARGAEVGPAADVYALGLVLIEALTGRRSYQGPALEAVLARLDRSPEIPAGLPQPWPELLQAMTAMDPQFRPGAAEVVRTLREGVAMPTPMLAGAGSGLLAGDAVLAGGAPLAAASGLTGTTALPAGATVAAAGGLVAGGVVAGSALQDATLAGPALADAALADPALANPPVANPAFANPGFATPAAAHPLSPALGIPMAAPALAAAGSSVDPAGSPELATAFIPSGLPPMPPPVYGAVDELHEPERRRAGGRGPLVGAVVAGAALLIALTAGGLVLANQPSTKNPSLLPGQAGSTSVTRPVSVKPTPKASAATSVAPIGSVPSSGGSTVRTGRSTTSTPSKSSAPPSSSSAAPSSSSAAPSSTAPSSSSSAPPLTSPTASGSTPGTSPSGTGSGTPSGTGTTSAAPAAVTSPAVASGTPTKSG